MTELQKAVERTTKFQADWPHWKWTDAMNEDLRLILSALQSKDGVWVPREPTEAMIEAYAETAHRFGFHSYITATTAWTAMLSAAQGGGDE